MGDGTNLVTIFAGELLKKAEDLLRLGLHTSDIIAGYEVAIKKALEILQELSIGKVHDLKSKSELQKVILPAVMSKQVRFYSAFKYVLLR
jgi:T-complex protein 1 subunit theta